MCLANCQYSQKKAKHEIVYNLWRIPRPKQYILSNVLSFHFLFWSPDTWMPRNNINKLDSNILDTFYYRKRLKVKSKTLQKKKVEKIHKQAKMIRRRLFLQLSQAQSTGLLRWPRLAETATRWRCQLIIKNLTVSFVSAFIFVLNRNPPGAYKFV